MRHSALATVFSFVDLKTTSVQNIYVKAWVVLSCLRAYPRSVWLLVAIFVPFQV